MGKMLGGEKWDSLRMSEGRKQNLLGSGNRLVSASRQVKKRYLYSP